LELLIDADKLALQLVPITKRGGRFRVSFAGQEVADIQFHDMFVQQVDFHFEGSCIVIHMFIEIGDRVGGVVTRYGLEGLGIILVGVRFSAPIQTGPGAHPASCTMGTGSFPGVKVARVRHPPHI
jgi:hypothetical protein